MKRLLGFLLFAACDSNDWARYDQLFQVEGNRSYEAGARVCGVARGLRHVTWLAGGYCGDTNLGRVAFGVSPLPSTLTVVQAEQPRQLEPIKLDAHERDYLALDPVRGLAWWEAEVHRPDRTPDQDIPVLRGVFAIEGARGDLVEHAVADGLVWVIGRGEGSPGALYRVDLEGARAPGSVPAQTSFSLPDVPAAVGVWEGGVVVAFQGAFQGIRLYDPAGEQVGEVATPVPPDGVKVGGRVAWVTGERQIWAIDLDTLQVVDEAGTPTVDDANIVMHADGPMFFLASGRDAVSMVWDGERPDKPKAVGGYHVGDGTWDIDTAGQTLYLAAGSRGMQVWAPRRDWDAFYGNEEE